MYNPFLLSTQVPHRGLYAYTGTISDELASSLAQQFCNGQQELPIAIGSAAMYGMTQQATAAGPASGPLQPTQLPFHHATMMHQSSLARFSGFTPAPGSSQALMPAPAVGGLVPALPQQLPQQQHQHVVNQHFQQQIAAQSPQNQAMQVHHAERLLLLHQPPQLLSQQLQLQQQHELPHQFHPHVQHQVHLPQQLQQRSQPQQHLLSVQQQGRLSASTAPSGSSRLGRAAADQPLPSSQPHLQQAAQHTVGQKQERPLQKKQQQLQLMPPPYLHQQPPAVLQQSKGDHHHYYQPQSQQLQQRQQQTPQLQQQQQTPRLQKQQHHQRQQQAQEQQQQQTRPQQQQQQQPPIQQQLQQVRNVRGVEARCGITAAKQQQQQQQTAAHQEGGSKAAAPPYRPQGQQQKEQQPHAEMLQEGQQRSTQLRALIDWRCAFSTSPSPYPVLPASSSYTNKELPGLQELRLGALEVLLADSPQAAHVAVEVLRSRMWDGVVAMGMECKPDAGRDDSKPIALLQLSSAGLVVVIRTALCGLPDSFRTAIVEDSDMELVVASWSSNDERKFEESFGVQTFWCKVTDVQKIAKSHGHTKTGIKALVQTVLEASVAMPKSKKQPDWSSPMLNPEQFKYAILDAACTEHIFRCLEGKF